VTNGIELLAEVKRYYNSIWIVYKQVCDGM